MLMQPGRLKDRVVIVRRSTSTDTQGGRAVSWVDLLTGKADVTTPLPAEVLPENQAEALEVQTAITATQRYRVTLRYRPGITATMRVRWTPYLETVARTLEIHGVALSGRQWLTLACAEVL